MNAMNLAFRSVGIAGAIAALGACTSLPVTADYNPNVGAGACHTYTWAQEHLANAGGPGGPYANPLNADRLRAAIDANLAARGIQKAPDKAAADCVVGFAIGSRLVADEYPAVGFGYGWGWGWGPRRYGGLGWDYPYARGGTDLGRPVRRQDPHRDLACLRQSERHGADRPQRRGEDQRRGGGDLHQVPGACADGRADGGAGGPAGAFVDLKGHFR
jgi:hypothetical protein